MISIKVISKNEAKKLIKSGLSIVYGFHPTPFGKCLIGAIEQNMSVCHLSFVDSEESDSLQFLSSEWSKAHLKEAPEETGDLVQIIFKKHWENTHKPLNVFVSGTEFQSQVWNTLLSIPEGTITSYENIASMTGNPNSVRASANAIARNKVAVLIPCHRVISKSGRINNYRWGQKRKLDLLRSENPTFDQQPRKKIKKLV